jgi:hypothetical protein
VIGGDGDHRALQRPNVSHQVGGSAQRHDRISDQLAGSVIGHATAAVRVLDRDPVARERLGVEQDLLLGRAPAQRVHVFVLEQEQGVGQLRFGPQLRHDLLQLERRTIRHPAEPDGEQLSHSSPSSVANSASSRI